jgi:hypothetical protein
MGLYHELLSVLHSTYNDIVFHINNHTITVHFDRDSITITTSNNNIYHYSYNEELISEIQNNIVSMLIENGINDQLQSVGTVTFSAPFLYGVISSDDQLLRIDQAEFAVGETVVYHSYEIHLSISSISTIIAEIIVAFAHRFFS